MNKSLKHALVGATLALAVAACATTQPIYNVQDATVVTTSGKHLSATQVRAAIITAGTSLGWHVADAGPGRLDGSLRLRGHSAVVTIPYSATKYSIVYKSSENLEESGGQIHRNYNGWVTNLDRAIRTELSRL